MESDFECDKNVGQQASLSPVPRGTSPDLPSSMAFVGEVTPSSPLGAEIKFTAATNDDINTVIAEDQLL